jgi:transcriptional antiterminator NusG
MSEEKRWYSLAGHKRERKKDQRTIEQEVQRQVGAEIITQVIVPSEKVYKIRNSKKVIMERNLSFRVIYW